MIIKKIRGVAPPGTAIPKPKARGVFAVKGIGRRRGEDALIYTIPNRTDPSKPYEKGVTGSELEKAYGQLIQTGQLTRSWFRENLTRCDAEGPCNFTTVGGLFELLGKAVYKGQGVYEFSKK